MLKTMIKKSNQLRNARHLQCLTLLVIFNVLLTY